MTHDLQTLIDKLNPVCRKGMEKAAELCVSQTHYNVEVEHYLLALLDLPETDLVHLFRHYDIRPEDAIRELRRFTERFRRGNTRTPALSPHILRLLEQSWMLSSLHFDAERIRSGAMLLALLDTEVLRAVVFEAAPVLKRFPRGRMKEEMAELLAETPEAGPRTGNAEPGGSPEPSKTPHLDQYTLDLTERARTGLIDPILGRDAEIRQLIDILTRRRQNNPILTGDAGVGKTAVVEGFALRIARGDVPPALKSISLRLLDLGLLQAGAGVKGEFEKRLKAVVDEVRTSPAPVILFIDEAHTLIGAGGSAGMGDAANLLKPALARGELRTIAATTWAEYKKYFEKDPALARRFQVVKVEEPDEAAAAEMLRGVAANLEAHHGVVILDEAVRDAVRLSHRYITGRQLPDKAIGVLDTACARVALGQNATPPEIEELIRQIDRTETELGLLHREQAVGHDHSERIEALASELARTKEARNRLEDRWKTERSLADRVIALEKKLTAGCGPGRTACPPTGAAEARNLADLKAQLAEVQGNAPMVPTAVDGTTVARVISGWTGIPAGRMMTDEIGTVLQMKSLLSERIVGQPEALDAICRRIRTYRAHLDDPSRPVGAFLLVGPSGVGKTETALALADILYGGERNLTVINMSEYQEAYTVSGLKGSPPGYVGHGKGGVLTEAVRRRPYSVVLLDEVEKAHPDVMELFYQVFDKGTLEDSEGVPVDFRNTILLLTSNVASEILLERCANPRNRPSAELVLDWIRPELQNHFRPAFLGRLVVVPYFPLDVDTIREIVELQMRKIQSRFLENHRLPLTYSDELAVEIAMRCTQADTGARNVDNILTHHLLPDLSGELLRRMAEGRPGAAVHVGMDGAGDFVYRFDEPVSAGGERASGAAASQAGERPREAQTVANQRPVRSPESQTTASPGPQRPRGAEPVTPPKAPQKPLGTDPAVPSGREERPRQPEQRFGAKAAEKPPKPEPAEPPPVSVEEWRAAQRESLPEFLRKPVRRSGGNLGGAQKKSRWDRSGDRAASPPKTVSMSELPPWSPGPSIAEPETSPAKPADSSEAKMESSSISPRTSDLPAEPPSPEILPPQPAVPDIPKDGDAEEPPHRERFRERETEAGEVDPEFGGTVPRFFIEGPQGEFDDEEEDDPAPPRKKRAGWWKSLFGG